MTNKLSEYGHTFQVKSIACLMTDVGFMSCTHDFMSDLKLFLVTVSFDVNHFNNSEKEVNLSDRHLLDQWILSELHTLILISQDNLHQTCYFFA